LLYATKNNLSNMLSVINGIMGWVLESSNTFTHHDWNLSTGVVEWDRLAAIERPGSRRERHKETQRDKLSPPALAQRPNLYTGLSHPTTPVDGIADIQLSRRDAM